MNKKIRPFLLTVFITIVSLQMVYAQRGFFRNLSNGEKNEKLKSTSVENIKKYSILEMDNNGLRNYLKTAPSTSKYTIPGIALEIPLPNGRTESFIIHESSVLTPELQTLHPDIRTYKGNGTQNPGYRIRFSLTSEGFNAIIIGVGGDAVVIEKIKNTNNLYKSYFSKDALMPDKPAFQSRCGTGGGKTLSTQKTSKNSGLQTGKFSNGNEIKKFRIAIAATGEYTAAFGSGNANAAYATIVAYVNEVNAVYETELGVNFQLVSGTNLVYTNPTTDPYTATDQITMLDENQANLDAVIGNSNYDIGHVFGAGGSGSGGGIAMSPSLCDDATKGNGASDIGDEIYYARVFSIQLIAHEIGHQFGMSHSYNSNIPVCTTRRYTTSVEPGSGATVMSYGFTCSNSNPADGVVGDDDYSNEYNGAGQKIGPFLNFHVVSIKQALDYISTLSCYTTIASGNSIPVINAMQVSYIIPKSTPFYLKGTATDGNNDPLSYSWEGTNISDLQDVINGNGQPKAPPSLDGTIFEDTTHPPFFRSYPPITTGTDPGLRYYPLLSAILAGTNYSRGDKLPSIAIDTKHTLTVRDGKGGTTTQDVLVKVDNSGPFLITNNPSGTYTVGSGLPVQWSVNGTNNAPVNCKLVDIWISTDGGNTFAILASALPNSGMATVTLPNTATTQGRIKVAPSTSTASGNIPSVFFDISNADFTIQAASCIPYTGQTMASGNTYCLNGNLTVGSNINIPNGATLIIQSGQLQSVDIQVNGNLEINDGASVKSTGSITIGVHGSNKNSRVKLGTKSFLSLTGSVSQGDPSFGGLYPGVASVIEMGTNSVVEICGTFTQQSTTYPSIKYVGTPTGKAYCIAKGDVSGGGIGSVLSDDSQIIAIAMGSVSNIGAGAASFCGPNATKSMCPTLWPAGLSEDKSSCGNAPVIIDKISFCTKPATIGTPDGITKLGITVQTKNNGWPESIPNGFIALEGKNKGFVITRVQHVSQTPQPGDSIADPKEGMILYDIQDKCVKIYNGTEWKCIQRSCND